MVKRIVPDWIEKVPDLYDSILECFKTLIIEMTKEYFNSATMA
jgi:hypothetical protein